jgi:Nif-specific regulatory protein
MLSLGIHKSILGHSDAGEHLLAAFHFGLRSDPRIADESAAMLQVQRQLEPLLAVARAWREKGDTIRADRAWSVLLALTTANSHRLEFALEQAQMLVNAIQFERALAVLDEVVHLGPKDGRVIGLHGWCLARIGRRDLGLQELEEALHLLPSDDMANLALFHSRLGISLFLSGRVEEGVRHLEESIRDAAGLNDPVLEARLRGNLGLRYRIEGKLSLSQMENTLAYELTRAHGRPEQIPTALANLMSTALDLCDWESWEKYRSLLEDTSRHSGNAIAFGRCYETRANCGILRGQTEEAARALVRVRPWFTADRNEEYFLFTRVLQAVIGSWHGEFARSVRRLKRILSRARSIGSPSVEALAARHLSEIMLIIGNLRSAERYADVVLTRRGSDVDLAMPSISTLAKIFLRRGNQSGLLALRTKFGSGDSPAIPPVLEEIAVYQALLRGDVVTAKAKARSVSSQLRTLDLAPREALFEWELGMALVSQGDSEGREHLSRAREIATRCALNGWSGKIAEAITSIPSALTSSSATQIDSPLLPRVIALMNSVVDFPTLLDQSLQLAATAIGASRGFILLTGQSELELNSVAQFGGVDDGARASALEISRTIVRRVTESGVPFIAGDVGSDPRLGSTQSLLDMAVRSLICVPLQTRAGVIGTIYLESNAVGSQFTTTDLDLVESFAGLIAVAIESGRLHDELKRSRERIVNQNLSLRRDVGKRFSRANIIGQSPEIVRVVSEAERVAVARSNVLITGETGTGKELIAKLIHYSSPRADQPLVSLNCGAFPQDLIESELFGIADRVATNVRARAGIFEQADGGTLFLDEIGELSPIVQVKLLRVLQEREFTPIGGKMRSVDFRLIAATNQDLRKLIDEGKFRSDLLFRINTVGIHIPPLRERKIDIRLLANHYLERFCEENARPVPQISSALNSVLLEYPWPGNVRELQNYIERLSVMCLGPVLEPMMMPGDRDQDAVTSPPESGKRRAGRVTEPEAVTHWNAVEDFERARILRALEESGRNQRRAAEKLGLKESTLRYQMKKLGLKPEVGRAR